MGSRYADGGLIDAPTRVRAAGNAIAAADGMVAASAAAAGFTVAGR